MKSRTTIWNLLPVAACILAAEMRAATVKFSLYGAVMLQSEPNPAFARADATLSVEGGGTLSQLAISSGPYYSEAECFDFGTHCDQCDLISPGAYQNVNLECGKRYTLTLWGQACAAGVSAAFSTIPAGHMLEFQDTADYSVSDNKTSVKITSITSKTWKVSLKPKRVHFTTEPVSPDGRSLV